MQSLFITIFLILFIGGTLAAAFLIKPKNNKLTNDYETLSTKRAFLTILSYAGIMLVLVSIVSSLAVVMWLNAKGYSSQLIDPSNPNYDANVYNEMSNFLNPMLELVIYSLLVVTIVLITYKSVLPDFKRFNFISIVLIILGVFGVLLSGIISNLINLIFGVSNLTSNQAAIEENLFSSNFGLISTFITTVIMAPIVEELVFRKSIFALFKGKNLAAIIVSSLFFGFIHVMSPATNVFLEMLRGSATYNQFILELFSLVSYSIMGATIGTVYVLSDKNIIVTILLHMAYNLLSLLIVIFA